MNGVQPPEPGKRVGVAVKAIVRKGDLYLVLYRAPKDSFAAGKPDLPGGRIEHGETPDEAIVREIKEETGLTVKVISPIKTWAFTDNVGTWVVGVSYLTEHVSGEVTLSFEHQRFEWLTADAVSKQPHWWGADEIRIAQGK